MFFFIFTGDSIHKGCRHGDACGLPKSGAQHPLGEYRFDGHFISSGLILLGSVTAESFRVAGRSGEASFSHPSLILRSSFVHPSFIFRRGGAMVHDR